MGCITVAAPALWVDRRMFAPAAARMCRRVAANRASAAGLLIAS